MSAPSLASEPSTRQTRLRRVPTTRAVRNAVDLLANVDPAVLAALAEAFIDRLDAAEDTDVDCCPTEDRPGLAWAKWRDSGPGDEDDAEHSLGWHEHYGSPSGCLHGGEEGDNSADDEEDDPQGDERHDPDLELSNGWGSHAGRFVSQDHLQDGPIHDDLEEQCDDDGVREGVLLPNDALPA